MTTRLQARITCPHCGGRILVREKSREKISQQEEAERLMDECYLNMRRMDRLSERFSEMVRDLFRR